MPEYTSSRYRMMCYLWNRPRYPALIKCGDPTDMSGCLPIATVQQSPPGSA
jgi:hypothetical protein